MANVSAASPFWPKANFKQINQFLSTIDWDFEFRNMNTNDSYNQFLSFITYLGRTYAPQKALRSSSSAPYKPWEYKPPRAFINSRKNNWNHYKEMRAVYGRNSVLASEALQTFLDVNYQYRNYSTQKQISYEEDILNNYSVKPKVFHSYIRGKKVGCPSVGPLDDADNLVSDPKEMAHLLGTALASVFTIPSGLPQSPHQVHDGSFHQIHFTVHDVARELSAINPSSAMGPDSVHPALLKHCSTNLAYPLFKIFSSSINSGEIPDIWKKIFSSTYFQER